MDRNEFTKLAALHRHWVMADAVRVVLAQSACSHEQQEETVKKFGIEYQAFGEAASMMFRVQIWYALLYVVVEGYTEIGRKHEALEELLAKEEYVNLLRRFRNAVFHYQSDPVTEKLVAFLEKEDSELWIHNLNAALQTFLLEALPFNEALEAQQKGGVLQIPDGSPIAVLFGQKK